MQGGEGCQAAFVAICASSGAHVPLPATALLSNGCPAQPACCCVPSVIDWLRLCMLHKLKGGLRHVMPAHTCNTAHLPGGKTVPADNSQAKLPAVVQLQSLQREESMIDHFDVLSWGEMLKRNEENEGVAQAMAAPVAGPAMTQTSHAQRPLHPSCIASAVRSASCYLLSISSGMHGACPELEASCLYGIQTAVHQPFRLIRTGPPDGHPAKVSRLQSTSPSPASHLLARASMPRVSSNERLSFLNAKKADLPPGIIPLPHGQVQLLVPVAGTCCAELACAARLSWRKNRLQPAAAA